MVGSNSQTIELSLLDFKDPIDNGNGTYDITVKHPVYGLIQFTAHPEDPLDHGKVIYENIRAGKHGKPRPRAQIEIYQAKASEERNWRARELSRADVAINRAEDAGDAELTRAWRQYRQALRDWPASPNFPDATCRPTAPVGA
jgi:hypothetical protein